MAEKEKVAWVEVIIKAFEELGGHASRKELFDKIKEMDLKDYSKIKKFNQTVQKYLQNYSSDAKNFKYEIGDPKKDLFYSVEGIGSGHWGLRNFIPNSNNVDLTEDDEGFLEGKEMLKLHICKERNHNVILRAKQIYKKKYGNLICQICNFDFEKVYGSIGKDYIEGHHIIPICELETETITKVEDIVLVCSNCHKMLHRKRPWLKPENLKKILSNNFK